VLEAAASGLPLVLVDDEAFAGIIENGKNGFSLPLKESEFAEKINLLLKDHALREEYGAYSRKLARSNFDGEELTSELLDFYSQTLDQYKKRNRLLKIIVSRASFTKLFKFSQLLTRFFDYLR
jgi:glycosyltransferase involved in cell wall biosynthesis